ncbi:esterase family protein, partial [Nocardia asiatica]
MAAVLSVAAFAFATGTAGSVSAGPAAPERPAPVGAAADGSHIASATPQPGGLVELTVFSAAMANNVTVRVLPAAGESAPAPTLYLLNGIDGGADGNWL